MCVLNEFCVLVLVATLEPVAQPALRVAVVLVVPCGQPITCDEVSGVHLPPVLSRATGAAGGVAGVIGVTKTDVLREVLVRLRLRQLLVLALSHSMIVLMRSARSSDPLLPYWMYMISPISADSRRSCFQPLTLKSFSA